MKRRVKKRRAGKRVNEVLAWKQRAEELAWGGGRGPEGEEHAVSGKIILMS